MGHTTRTYVVQQASEEHPAQIGLKLGDKQVKFQKPHQDLPTPVGRQVAATAWQGHAHNIPPTAGRVGPGTLCMP